MAYCTFAGHRNIFMADVDKKIEKAIEGFLQADESITFYTGGMGEFDSKCSTAVRAAKHRHPSKIIRLVLVLPYMTNRLNTDKIYYETYYDDVMIPMELCGVHPKAAIQKRNRWMVDQSDCLIACVHRDFGGAYDTLKYAIRKGITVINLAEQ